MSALRALRSLATSSVRSASARSVARPVAMQACFAAARPMTVTVTRSFSATPRSQGEGATDLALVQKLQEEVQYEAADTDPKAIPQFLEAFQSQGVWNIADVSGSDEIIMTRTFGNESIRLMFTIADINELDHEEFEQQAAEDQAQVAEDEEIIPTAPIRVAISITKSTSPGALTIDAVCQEAAFVVENISFFNDGKLANELTAEADWKRRGLYIGPEFDTLDIGVQEEFDKFLQERGINENLAMFIPEFAEYKEQKEYVQWLSSVKKFIEN